MKTKDLKAAAKAEPEPSDVIRKRCAARLMTLVEKAGKAQKKAEPDNKATAKRQPQTLPGPPSRTDSSATVAELPRSEQKQEGSDKAMEAEGASAEKQHERRGENLLLKEVVDYLRTLQEAKVSKHLHVRDLYSLSGLCTMG